MDGQNQAADHSHETSLLFKHLGFKTVQYEEGNVVIKLEIQDVHMNANQTLHGGIHATMIDNIIGATIRSLTNLPSTTINLTIQYLKPISKGVITARAIILLQGYKIITAEGIIYDEYNQLIAKGTGTFKVLHPRND